MFIHFLEKCCSRRPALVAPPLSQRWGLSPSMRPGTQSASSAVSARAGWRPVSSPKCYPYLILFCSLPAAAQLFPYLCPRFTNPFRQKIALCYFLRHPAPHLLCYTLFLDGMPVHLLLSPHRSMHAENCRPVHCVLLLHFVPESPSTQPQTVAVGFHSISYCLLRRLQGVFPPFVPAHIFYILYHVRVRTLVRVCYYFVWGVVLSVCLWPCAMRRKVL